MAHREQGGIEEENGSCLFKCHFYEVTPELLPFFEHYMGLSHNGKTFLAMFYSACLSVWLRLHYWQWALSLVKLRQHLGTNQKQFSCCFV